MYNRIKELNGKKLDAAIKRGATREDLCREYGCSSTQLDRQISQVYNNKYVKLQEVWRALRDNGRRKVIETNEDTATILSVAEEVEARLADLNDECRNEDTAKDGSTKEREIKRAFDARLRSLKEEENRLMGEVRVFDEKIAKAQEQFDSCQIHVNEAITRVELAEARVAEAQKELEQKQKKFEELCGIADEKSAVLEGLKTEREAKMAETNKVRAKIWELTQVTLGVDVEAEEIMVIDAPANSWVNLNTSGAEEVFNTLIQQVGCDDFKLKNLKMLARTIAAAHNMNAKVRLMCDDAEFCRVFEEFV